jgi:hypothetical protein
MRGIAKVGMMALAATTLGACATQRDDGTLRSAGEGAAIGALGGAAVGAVVGGISPVEGAVAGAVIGGAVGAATAKHRHWIRDDQGFCYYVNDKGDRVYDRRRNC